MCKNCGEPYVYQRGLCFGCFNDPYVMEPGRQ